MAATTRLQCVVANCRRSGGLSIHYGNDGAQTACFPLKFLVRMQREPGNPDSRLSSECTNLLRWRHTASMESDCFVPEFASFDANSSWTELAQLHRRDSNRSISRFTEPEVGHRCTETFVGSRVGRRSRRSFDMGKYTRVWTAIRNRLRAENTPTCVASLFGFVDPAIRP